jgi:CheY-like chemotaxis protein
LIVDDQPDVGRSLARLLRLHRHEVRVVQDGASAVESVVQDPPEIVFLDIGLPQMDGFQVAQSIRRQPGTDSIVLVAVTGYGQEADRRRSIEAGFNTHLVKPVDPNMLLTLINSFPPQPARTSKDAPADFTVVKS